MVDRLCQVNVGKLLVFLLFFNLRINGYAKDQNLKQSYVALNIVLRCLQLQEYLYNLINPICFTSIPLNINTDYRACQNIKNVFQYFLLCTIVQS
jgi:hypothetical protein